ncbi:MAG: hypothetical protein CMJ62_20810 [Planctomycetaceae bacterium]|nr:hypothetical protein [Planctomycetaceae bacterium]
MARTRTHDVQRSVCQQCRSNLPDTQDAVKSQKFNVSFSNLPQNDHFPQRRGGTKWSGQRLLAAVASQTSAGGATGSVDRVAGRNHSRQVDHFLPVRRPVPVMLKKNAVTLRNATLDITASHAP